MPFRPKLFFTFSLLCVTPLLILSLFSLLSGLKSTEVLLRDNLEGELSAAAHHYETLVSEREHELLTLARGPLPNYLRHANSPEAIALIETGQGSSTLGVPAEVAHVTRQAITELPMHGLYFADIGCFAADKHLLFLVDPVYQSPIFRTKDFLPARVEPDARVWKAQNDSPLCSIAAHPTSGDVRRCSVPIFLTSAQDAGASRGAIVADIKLDLLFAQAVRGRDLSAPSGSSARLAIVLDSAGTIVYHPNDALRHQPIDSAIPSFAQIVDSIRAGKDSGSGEYRSAEGDTWIAAYEPIDLAFSLAVARNYSLATRAQRRAGWLGVVLAILFGLGGASLLTAYFQKKTARIERVTARVASIASGNLEQRVEAPSSDELRLIADSVNVMSERLREQIARETEAHQFQSFVKLSALLTHDLKNAIEALSLTVSNMERHFDKPEFRADTLKGLTSATDKLRALVARLSNPVNTMSGEFKLPRPTDLVPLLKRVLAQNAEPLSGMYEIEVRLPPSLFALADAERIEKVMENLVLNSIEAMSGNGGKLTVAAGTAEADKVFFSVTDTGVGMSLEFIQQRLFRPFATTKKRGVGLGLYTCREVIRATGGTIEVDSMEGSGTTFRVVLASAG